MAKVVIAMSGGVDSSPAAVMLKQAGHKVTGITMKIWDGDDAPKNGDHHACYGPGEAEDIEDARKIARMLDIPFYVFDLTQEYKKDVLDYISSEYLSGRTPNPCVRCNCNVKFGALIKKAQDSGLEFDYFASGHYVKAEYDKSRQRYILKKAQDVAKDQSYFLFSLSQEQLSLSLFPLSNYTKGEIRKVARTFGLEVKDKPESQDFITGGYHNLVRGKAQPGPIVDKQGNILGQHRGIPFYTIGQRKRLGVFSSEPLYVTVIDCEKNSLTVGPKSEIYQREFTMSRINWIAIPFLTGSIRAKIKIRYHHKEADALITPLPENEVTVVTDEPQMAITPGQAAVFYDRDTVLGGGTIERVKQHSN